MAHEIQDMIDALPANGGLVALENKQYATLDVPLNLRDKRDVWIAGQGASTKIPFHLPGPWPCFDMTGSTRMEVGGVSINGLEGGKQAAGILLARNPAGQDSGSHKFDRVVMNGHFKTNVCSVASEVNVWEQPHFRNNASGITYNYWTSGEPPQWISSPLGPITGSTNAVTEIRCPRFYSGGDTSEHINFYFGSGTSYLNLSGGSVGSQSSDRNDQTKGGKAAVWIDGSDRECKHITIQSVQFETLGAQLGLVIEGELHHFILAGVMLQAREEVIMISGVLEDSSIGSWCRLYGGFAEYSWPQTAAVEIVRDSVVADTSFSLHGGTTLLYRDSPNIAIKRPHRALYTHGLSVMKRCVVSARDSNDVECHGTWTGNTFRFLGE
jgi:hypothetical protein